MRGIETLRVILNKILQQANSQRVKKAHLVLGELVEITDATIQQQWGELSQGTLAEHAQLHIRLIKANVQCMTCFQKYQPLDGKIHCPYCGSYGAKILSGEEFHLEAIELDDA